MLASSFPLAFFIALCWAAFAFSVLLTVVFRKKVGSTIALGLVITLLLSAAAWFFASPPGSSAAVWARSRAAVAERADRRERVRATKESIRTQRTEARAARANAEAERAHLDSMMAQLDERAPVPEPDWADRADGPISPPHAVAPTTATPAVPPTLAPHPLELPPRHGFLRDLEPREGSRLAWNLLSGLAIAAFLGLGYVACDSMTRGHFTWQLRVVAVVAFAAMWFAASALRASF